MTSQSNASAHATPSRPRLLAFRVITLLIPFVALAGLEFSLRLFGYGQEYPLVVRTQKAGKDFYTLNREVGKRYFRQAGIVVPEPSEELFAIEKSPTTKRIFCIGESTIAGFPYEFNATAPSFLRQWLNASVSDHNIEVVNVGLSAIGSYVIADFAEELMDYSPDLLVLYSGHNEFYGAFGSASTVGIGGNPSLTRIYLKLSSLRIFMLLRDALAWAAGLFGSSNPQAGETLMAGVVADNEIPYGSSQYGMTVEAYESNIRRIIAVAREHNVPVMVSALVSNIRTHPPFRSSFLSTTPASDRSSVLSLLAKGDSLVQHGEIEDAVSAYDRARQIDSTYALVLFKLGSAYNRLRQSEQARYYLDQARDYDLLRFRASGEFGQRLRAICAEEGVQYSPVDSTFEANSPDGLVGSELMTEHLHPNIHGYFLMAQTFAKTIRESGVLLMPDSWLSVDGIADAARERSHVTAFDTLMGQMKISLMTHRWPFVERAEPYTITPRSNEEEIVYRYVRQQAGWSDSRYALAAYYASVNRFHEAREECLAISNVIPFSYEPLIRVGDYYEAEGRLGDAERTYRRAYGVQDNPYARVRLSILLLQREAPGEAMPEIEHALSLSPGLLTPEQHAFVLYLSGIAHAKLGNFPKAREQAQAALRYDPGSAEAKELLRQLAQIK